MMRGRVILTALGAFYGVTGVMAAIALHLLIPTADLVGCVYFGSMWPAFFGADILHTPRPPTAPWMFSALANPQGESGNG